MYEANIETIGQNSETTTLENDICANLDSIEVKEWANIIYSNIDSLLSDSAKHGKVVLKIARRFMSGYDDYGNRGDRAIMKEFFSGVPAESGYDSSWKRFIDRLYETVDIIREYDERYLFNGIKSPVTKVPAETIGQEVQILYERLLSVDGDSLIQQVSEANVEVLSHLSTTQMGEVIYHLVTTPGLDELEIFSILEKSLFSRSEGRLIFLAGFEAMVIKYTHISTDQKGIFKIYAMWETIARSADYFDFQTFFASTLRMYAHSAVDPYLKMRFVIELNKWLIGNREFRDFIVEKLDLSSINDDLNTILLDLLDKQSRGSDRRYGSVVVIEEIIAKCEERHPISERNYFLNAQLTGIKNAKNYTGSSAVYSPLYIGDDQYIVYDPYGAAYISSKSDFTLIKTLARHTAAGGLNARKVPSILIPDRKSVEESDEFYDSGMFEKHEDFLTSSGEDFIKVAQKYGFRIFDSVELSSVRNSSGSVSEPEVAEYLYMMQPTMRILLADSYGIDVTKLSRAEQFYLLNYLKHNTVAEVETMQAFIKMFGVDALRSFLALAQTEDVNGDQIVSFGISSETETARKVFAGYCNLLDQMSDIDDFLEKEFEGNEETKKQIAVAAKDRLQKHAANFLSAHLKRRDSILEIESAGILVEVEKAAGLASAISSALRSHKITSVDTFQSFRQDILRGCDVRDSSLFPEMLQIYRRNYTDKYAYTEEGRQALLDSFTNSLGKDSTQVYVWRIGDSDVLTFLYADEYSDKSQVYIGGLNSNPTFNDSKAGKGLIEQMLRDYDEKRYIVTAEAAPSNAAAYMTLYDFVAFKRKDDSDEPFVLDVARNADWDFKSKRTPRNEVLKQLENANVYTAVTDTILYVKGESNSNIVDLYLDKGYVITKLFIDHTSDDTATNYSVLEYAPFAHAALSATGSEIANAA